MASVQWRGDGKALLVAGTDGQARGGWFEVDPVHGGSRLLYRDDSAGPGTQWLGADRFAYLAPQGVVLSSHGKVSELAAGSGFSLLTAASGGELAWLAPGGICLFRGGKQELFKAPAAKLTELAFAGNNLLAGNGKELWLIPLDGALAQLLSISPQRIGKIALHPDGKRIAYTTGGTQSSVWKVKLP